MVGTGLVTIPWAYSKAGLLLGIGLTILAFVISFYTCYLVIRTAGKDIDFTDTLWKHFGRKGWMAGMIIFIFNLCIPIIIYFELLAQTLYPILLAVLSLFMKITQSPTDLSINFSTFSYTYTCIIMFAILFLVTLKKDLAIFVKINTFGVIFVFIIIIFVLSYGIFSMTNTDYHFVIGEMPQPYTSGSNVRYISLINKDFAPLMGILGGGYYLHNISLPVIRNSRNPKKNMRDVFLGYLFVCISYIACGTLGYFGF